MERNSVPYDGSAELPEYKPVKEKRKRNAPRMIQEPPKTKEGWEALYKSVEKKRLNKKAAVEKILAINPNYFKEIGAKGHESRKLAKLKVENGQ